MNRWCGKVAVVTGASSGIGAATAVRLAEDGCITIGLARRVERIEQLKCTLKEGHKGDLIAMQCDCSLEGEVRNVFECITSTYGNIQILVNAAGVNRKFLLLDGCNSEEMRNVVDTNLMGPVYCIREAYKSMKKTKSGHIININSILGHKVIYFGALEVPPMNMYPSTKYAMTAMTEVLRQELQVKKTPYIKITVRYHNVPH